MRALSLVAGLALVALGAGGCDASGEPAAGAKLTIYLSTPLSGPNSGAGLAVADGARAALAQAGGDAAGVDVGTLVLDSGPGAGTGRNPATSGPDPARAAANARDATEDTTAIAYIGELDSPTTRTSLPITNDARLLQVSPTADASYLTAPFEGSDEIPTETQASGVRTFGTLGGLAGTPRELGREAMSLVLDSVEAADDPLDRASVVAAFFGLGERDSPLGVYTIDDVGVAQRR